MDWYTSKHSLINYVTYCTHFKPDLVVVIHAINNIMRSFSPSKYAIGEYDTQYTHFFGPSIKGANPPTFEKHFADRYLRAITEPWFSRYRFVESDVKLDKYVSLKQLETNISKLIDIVRADSSEIILVSQPFLYKSEMSQKEKKSLGILPFTLRNKIGFMKEEYPTQKSIIAAMNEANNRVKNISFQKNVHFVDGERALKKNMENFIDDVHFTKKGADRLASAITKYIVDNQIVYLK